MGSAQNARSSMFAGQVAVRLARLYGVDRAGRGGPRRLLDRGRRWLSAILAGALVAGVLALVVGAAGPLASPAAAAGDPPRICSGGQVSGEFHTPTDSASFTLYMATGATVYFSGSADILARDTTGGWGDIFK